jgi:hypothetical protein
MFVLFFVLDPYFVPEISVKGVTLNSITIGWSQPPEEMRDHVHYYMLIIQNNSTTKEAFHPGQSMNLFLFTDLQSAMTYRFKVSFIHSTQRVQTLLLALLTTKPLFVQIRINLCPMSVGAGIAAPSTALFVSVFYIRGYMGGLSDLCHKCVTDIQKRLM